MRRNAIDLTGMRFGRLKVIGTAGRKAQPSGKTCIAWNTQCDCGNKKVVIGLYLRSVRTASCGCLRKEINASQVIHGYGLKDKVYRTWRGIRRRCGNKTYKEFRYYGGRGITVCERWKSFVNFLADMGDAPPGMSIDRIDNNGPYSPSNCRWATQSQQQANRRDTRLISYLGQTKCIAEWERSYGMTKGLLNGRLNRGLKMEDAIKLRTVKREEKVSA